MNIIIHMFVQMLFFSQVYPSRWKGWNCMISIYLTFKESARLFSTMVVSFIFPQNMLRVPVPLNPQQCWLVRFYILNILIDTHSVTSSGFNLHFLMNYVGHLFLSLFTIYLYIFSEVYFQMSILKTGYVSCY